MTQGNFGILDLVLGLLLLGAMLLVGSLWFVRKLTKALPQRTQRCQVSTQDNKSLSIKVGKVHLAHPHPPDVTLERHWLHSHTGAWERSQIWFSMTT